MRFAVWGVGQAQGTGKVTLHNAYGVGLGRAQGTGKSGPYYSPPALVIPGPH